MNSAVLKWSSVARKLLLRRPIMGIQTAQSALGE